MIQVTKVWWDGDKLMSELIEPAATYKEPEQPAPVHEMTPEMIRKVQMHSELGEYAASNLVGAYDLFQEFWRVAMSAAPQPAQQEPVACQYAKDVAMPEYRCVGRCQYDTSPPAQRTWVGLTDEEIEREWQFLHDEEGNPPDHHDFARAIEAAHGIGEKK